MTALDLPTAIGGENPVSREFSAYVHADLTGKFLSAGKIFAGCKKNTREAN
jgi:hypothetical protein